MDTQELLAERGKTHGRFEDHARITQRLKMVVGQEEMLRAVRGQPPLSDTQREALSMIAHKVGRIIAGDADYVDHWDDIAGYAKLCSKPVETQAVPAPAELTEQEQKDEALRRWRGSFEAQVDKAWDDAPAAYDREDHQDERPTVPLSLRIEENLIRIETEGRFAHACPDIDQELPERILPRYEGFNPDASRSRRELATHPDNQGLGVTSHGEQLRKAS